MKIPELFHKKTDEEEAIEKYKEAGRITADAMKVAVSLAKEGAKLLDIATKAEERIMKRGAQPAFPVNISINNRAAHYTPYYNDETELHYGDFVKLDLGAAFDGYIGDMAKTVLIGKSEHAKMIPAAESALEEALKMCVPGTDVVDIGKKVEETIRSYGYKPVENLCGHGLGRWLIHTGINVPNVGSGKLYVLKKGDVVAIEPFVTNGVGRVRDEDLAEIFSFISDRPTRLRDSRKIMEYVKENYRTMPFAERWLINNKVVPPLILNRCMRELLSGTALRAYPVLKEVGNGLIAQAEHTVIVDDVPYVTTR